MAEQRASTGRGRLAALLGPILSWWDSAANPPASSDGRRRIHWARLMPFIVLHVGALGVIWVGWSPVAVVVAIGFYMLRAFFVTAFYHRYFSHRTYKTTRAAQLVFAVAGNSAVQRGPLWWAAHHRRHHQAADSEGDPHSPHVDGVLWSHIGWLTDPANFPTDMKLVPDLARYPELRWLDRFDTLVPTLVAGAMFGLGVLLNALWPGLGTSGFQMLIWGFFVSTVILFHTTCLVNSATHLVGKRVFQTRDESRNSLVIALLTMGEGWHNNHHRFPGATRQGFTFWEIDPTYMALKVMSWFRVIWDMQPVPAHVMATRKK